MPIPPNVDRSNERNQVQLGWQPVPSPLGANFEATADLDRDARMPRLIDAPADLSTALRSLVVVVVGAGSIGLRVVDALARMGIGGLWICDGRSTKPESILTHPVGPDELDVPKASLAAARAKSISGQTDVRCFAGPFEDLPLDALADADWVVVCSDNPAAEISVSQRCLNLGLPHLQASVYGAALVATVRTLTSGSSGANPCLACGFTPGEWADLDRGTLFSCEGATVANAAPKPSSVPTTSLPHLCSLAADMAVGELVRVQLGLGLVSEAGTSLEYCGYDGRTTRTRLPRNPDCPLEHSAWRVHTSDAPLGKLTPLDVARISGVSDRELVSTSIEVDGHRFVALAACECMEHLEVGKFLAVGRAGGASFGEDLGECPDCHGSLVPHPFYAYSKTPWGALRGCLDRDLDDLGAAAATSILVRAPHGTTLVRPPASARPLCTAGSSLTAPDPEDPQPANTTPSQEVSQS